MPIISEPLKEGIALVSKHIKDTRADTKILVSIGGYGAGGFCEAASAADSRKVFAKSGGKNTAPPETMLLCHIGMKVFDYATILSQYENSYNGEYVKGGYDNNDLPFHTEAEWSRPSDRSYIEYDGSNNEITSNEEIMSKVKEFSKNSKEKEANAAISQYWILADNTKRESYINGENTDFPTPKKIAELVPIIDRGYAIHRENDVFLSTIIEKGSTKRVVTGHNHCDGYEVLFDGITYTSVVKTGSIDDIVEFSADENA